MLVKIERNSEKLQPVKQCLSNRVAESATLKRIYWRLLFSER